MTVTMQEVIAELSERGRVEWELAATKAALKKLVRSIQDDDGTSDLDR